MRDLSKCISSYVLLCLKNICCYFEHNFRKSKRNVLAAKPLDKISFDPKTLISPDLDSRYVFLEEGIVLDFCSFFLNYFTKPEVWFTKSFHGFCLTLSKKTKYYNQAPCSQSFFRFRIKIRLIFQNEFGLFPIICSRKLDLCIHRHGKCCFRPKMHNIKLYVGDN